MGEGIRNGEGHSELKWLLAIALAGVAFAQTPAALREDVTYLASEELAGRNTPSPGLDLAAEFIADGFAKAPLASTGSYFQGPNRKKGPRNVIGILPGSDPILRKQFVIVSAHYDHLGRGFPGANDNASGVASLIEIANALSGQSLKRTVLFIAFYGEEKGLWGSNYYVQHPLVPLKDTVAAINLEQLGRTDDDSGPKIATFGMTGTSLSNLPAMIDSAVNAAGVEIYHRPDEDSFFNRSDNYPFASKGVPDTTLVVAFDFPDYHKAGDTPDKLDYDNLALVDRGIEAAILELANSTARPVWTRK